MKRAAEAEVADASANAALHDHGVAMQMLQTLLPALRSDRKDSSSMSTKFELILDEWQMDVATQKKEKPQSCKPANAAWRDAKYRMRKGKHTAAAMALVKTSDASEQQQLHKYVMMLQSSSGRAKLIEMLDAKIEHAAGVDGVPTSSEDDGPSNDCVRQPAHPKSDATALDIVLAAVHASSAGKDLTRRHGAASVTSLIAALAALPCREHDIEDDLNVINSVYAARTQPGVTLRKLSTSPSAKAARIDTKDTIKCRVNELRSALPVDLAREFLELSAAAAPMRSAVVTENTAEQAALRLAYDVPTPIAGSECGAVPLPYGCVLIPECVDAATGQIIGAAASIPEQWPLQISPSQFQISDTCGVLLKVPRAYEVGDVARDTKLSLLLDDIRAFLKSALGSQFTPSMAASLRLSRCENEQCMLLAPDADAEAADLFNLGAADWSKGGVELVVITMPTSPAVRPPSPEV